ncbi:unnamed protein product [Arctia plantaginis]|uniref:Inosine/uridine-preferring nucleoside hydrolase domain-containing protein n=1 Tax=Arctia plantaginis TaxID=874455 RepID=A0A8S1AGG5_ARCPL|nr:unnamed protein product [Arctia plantaginis]
MIKFLLPCIFIIFSVNCQNVVKEKIIIDNDAGGDDAMAIFLTLLYEKNFDGPHLAALTTVNGNTNEDNVCHNNQKVLKIANRTEIPIYRGSKNSLSNTPVDMHYYGEDGLGDNDDIVTDLVPAANQSAISALIDYSKLYEGNLTVITIGTLTNVAIAMTLDPGFLGRLKHLYVGAGTIHSGKHQRPEFNARVDAEAYRIVVQNANPDKVTMVPFSLIDEYLTFTKEWRFNTFGAIATEIIANQNRFERVSLKNDVAWQSLDPAVVTFYLRPDLVNEYKYSENDIILCGDGRGITTNKFVSKEKANVRIIYSVKAEEYRQFLLDVFGYDSRKPVDYNK